jgi:hypothetical protein
VSAPNLCSRERAKYNLPSATTADDRTIDALIGAASAAIQKHCRRTLALARFDEVLDGTLDPRLLLREYPIQAVESVRYSPQPVLEVQNTLTATNQQARVTVTSTGLELVRVASGVLSRDTSVTHDSFPTLASMAAAIAALGNGWTARVSAADFALFPGQDLWVAPCFGDAQQSQGAMDCRGRYAALLLHTQELSGYAWDARGWLYRRDAWRDAGYDTQRQLVYPWVGGPGYWRVQYTAGYQEIPEDVQEACAAWVSVLFEQTKHDPSLATLSIHGSLSQTWTQPGLQPPARVAALLAPYRRQIV